MNINNKIEKTIYLTAVIAMLMKVALALGVALELFSVNDIMYIMQEKFGATTYDVNPDNGFMNIIPRLGGAADLVYLIIFLFYAKKHNGIKVILMGFLTIAFTLVVNSRYLMMSFALMAIYLILTKFKTNLLKKIFVSSVVFSLLVLFGIGNLTYFDSVYLEIIERFTGKMQAQSDSHRVEQFYLLTKTFQENQLFGIGLGGYVEDVIRNESRKWNYELEYFSLLMQLGIVGFVFIVVNFIIYVNMNLFSNYNKKLSIAIQLSVALWLASSLQSALFVGGTSAFIALSIFFLSRKCKPDTKYSLLK